MKSMRHTARPRTLAAGLAGLFLLSGCVRLDMYDQPHHEPLEQSPVFQNQQASRPDVAGTVARGELRQDSHFYTGMNNATEFTDEFPFRITEEVMQRGRQRYNIFCSQCHDRVGNGRGMVVRRGYKQPESFHIDRLRSEKAGYFFDVITNGFATMPAHKNQIPPADRWAIVAYVRALQLSQHAVLGNLPPAISREIRDGIRQAESEAHDQSEEHH